MKPAPFKYLGFFAFWSALSDVGVAISAPTAGFDGVIWSWTLGESTIRLSFPPMNQPDFRIDPSHDPMSIAATRTIGTGVQPSKLPLSRLMADRFLAI